LFNQKEKMTMHFDTTNKIKSMEDGNRLDFLFGVMTANK
jgi:hypothetical protein